MFINIFHIMEDMMLFLKKDSFMPQLLSSLCLLSHLLLRASRWLSGKASACNAGDMGLIPGLGISPGGGHGNSSIYV